MSPDTIILTQGITSILAVVALGVIAQRERVKREDLEEALADAHKWVDEIVEALQDPDEGQGNIALDRLVAEFRNDE